MIEQEKIDDFLKALNEKFPVEGIYDNFFAIETGKKYHKIVSTDGKDRRSSYGFIDKETGDLFKAASWAAPAKHARGNILDESGLNACEKHSVIYLR
jgi:hypothetical protein